MVASTHLAAVGTLLLASTPLTQASSPKDHGLRLIKTSLDHDGIWVTEQEKFDNLIAKHVHFVDITDTRDTEMMRRDRIASFAFTSFSSASTSPNARQSNSTYTYPPSAQRATEAKPLLAAINGQNQQTWLKQMTDMYSRYYKGCWAPYSAQWMFDTVTAAAKQNTNINVSQFTHKAYNQPSVIARLEGSKSPDKVVIVSAHYDSVSTSPGARAPGADDNGSGVVTILESLRVFAEKGFQPENTLEWHFYSGEEGGTLGSRDVMQSYAQQKVNVIALMNQDMTGYSPNNVIAVFTDYVDDGLTEFIAKIVPTYSSLPVLKDKCGYGCLDHNSAFEVGYPAAYVCDEGLKDATPYMHSPKDTYDTVSFNHVLEHTKFTVGFLVEGAYF